MLISFYIFKAIQQFTHIFTQKAYCTHLHVSQNVPKFYHPESEYKSITKIILFSVHINLQNHFTISHKDLFNIVL